MSSLFNKKQLEKVRAGREAWEKDLAGNLVQKPDRKARFSTVSDLEIKSIYSPEEIAHLDYEQDLGFPSQYPYPRGVQTSMDRGQLWTMRMFAGLGSAEDTNQRFHYLVQQGQTGLSTAFHMPTLMGYDSDSPLARGECGKCGVAIDTLKDMEEIFEGIDLGKVSTSFTINATAAILLAMYVAVGEKQGVASKNLRGINGFDLQVGYGREAGLSVRFLDQLPGQVLFPGFSPGPHLFQLLFIKQAAHTPSSLGMMD